MAKAKKTDNGQVSGQAVLSTASGRSSNWIEIGDRRFEARRAPIEELLEIQQISDRYTEASEGGLKELLHHVTDALADVMNRRILPGYEPIDGKYLRQHAEAWFLEDLIVYLSSRDTERDNPNSRRAKGR